MKKIKYLIIILSFLPFITFGLGIPTPDYYKYENENIIYRVYDGNNTLSLLNFPINFKKEIKKIEKNNFFGKSIIEKKLEFIDLSLKDKIYFTINLGLYLSLIIILVYLSLKFIKKD